MKRITLAAALWAACCFGPPGYGQDWIDWEAVDHAVENGAAWIREQTGIDMHAVLDVAAVQQGFREIEAALQSDDVFDLALLREEASGLLTLLQGFDATRPYAAWLATRMDYFDVLEDLFDLPPVPPPPPPVMPPSGAPPPALPPRAPPPRRPNPTAQQQRGAWEKKMENQPVPRGAEQLVPGLKRIFAQHGTPQALVWLAEVESSFNPAARSPVGALGLFQFMPRTAESLGLRLAPEDERRNPDRSAAAAAIYLNRLHGRFQDWPLALAAYNAGQGRVGGLLNKHGASRFDEIAVHLPTETQMYVPKIEATLRRREGVGLGELPGPRPSVR